MAWKYCADCNHLDESKSLDKIGGIYICKKKCGKINKNGKNYTNASRQVDQEAKDEDICKEFEQEYRRSARENSHIFDLGLEAAKEGHKENSSIPSKFCCDCLNYDPKQEKSPGVYYCKRQDDYKNATETACRVFEDDATRKSFERVELYEKGKEAKKPKEDKTPMVVYFVAMILLIIFGLIAMWYVG